MGYNSVIMLLNDGLSQIAKDPKVGEKIQDGVRAHGAGDYHESSISAGNHIGCMKVLSCEHADTTQVVVVGQNTGRLVTGLEGAREEDLEALAEVLRMNGYGVKGPQDKQMRKPHKFNEVNWPSNRSFELGGWKIKPEETRNREERWAIFAENIRCGYIAVRYGVAEAYRTTDDGSDLLCFEEEITRSIRFKDIEERNKVFEGAIKAMAEALNVELGEDSPVHSKPTM